MIDQTIDVDKEIRRINRMAESVKSMMPAGASDLQKVAALRVYLHKPGPWNGYRAFSYDFGDPLGKTVTHKLLTVYIRTRKGNCVSMPLLFVILGQRLGLTITASTAPRHVLAKYRLPTGKWINIEATSGGGFARDSWVQRGHPMTREALLSGIYLRPLTKHETVVVMLSTLMEHYANQGWHEAKIPLAELALHYWPKSVSAMLHMRSAYAKQLQRDCVSKYSTLQQAPVDLRPRCALLLKRTNLWWNKAEALGWRAPTAKEEAAYRNMLLEAAVVHR